MKHSCKLSFVRCDTRCWIDYLEIYRFVGNICVSRWRIPCVSSGDRARFICFQGETENTNINSPIPLCWFWTKKNWMYTTKGFDNFFISFFNCGKSRSRTALPGVTALRRGKEETRKRKSWQKQRKLESPHTRPPLRLPQYPGRLLASYVPWSSLFFLAWHQLPGLGFDEQHSERAAKVVEFKGLSCPVRGQIAPGACSTSLFLKAEAIGKIKKLWFPKYAVWYINSVQKKSAICLLFLEETQ